MAGESTVAELILKIIADSTEVRKALKDATDATKGYSTTAKTEGTAAADAIKKPVEGVENAAKKTNDAVQKVGGSLRQLSRQMVMFGTILSGPVIAALAATASMNSTVGLAMFKMGDATKKFSEEIAVAALPVVEKFTAWLVKMTKEFEKLPQGMKDTVFQGMLVVGMFLIFTGTIVKILSMWKILGPVLAGLPTQLYNIGKAVGLFLISPWGLVLVAIATFITVFLTNFAGFRDLVLQILEDMGRDIDWWIKKINQAVDVARIVKRTVSLMLKGMDFETATKVASAEVKAGREAVDKDAISIESRVKSITAVIRAEAEKLKKAGFGGLLKQLLGGGEDEKGSPAKNKFVNFVDGFKLGLEQMKKDLSDFGKMGVDIANKTASAMQNAFSTYFFDLFTGELKTAQEYISGFGKAILQMIAELIAKLITLMIVTAALNAIPGGTVVLGMLSGLGKLFHSGGTVKHEGGYIRKAHEGLTTGEVPIIAQTGEGILSRNGMAALGGSDNLDRLNAGESMGGSPTIVIAQTISAWDASDVYRNRKLLSAAIANEIKNNGDIRQAMKKYM